MTFSYCSLLLESISWDYPFILYTFNCLFFADGQLDELVVRGRKRKRYVSCLLNNSSFSPLLIVPIQLHQKKRKYREVKLTSCHRMKWYTRAIIIIIIIPHWLEAFFIRCVTSSERSKHLKGVNYTWIQLCHPVLFTCLCCLWCPSY